MSTRYFQSELAYLRRLGREFAAANPSLAGMLSERGHDPDVERLLEGFAFLTAKIRERSEDGVPEVALTLADALVPQLAAPLPAATIVEFTPQTQVRERTTLPIGTEVASTPIAGTRCRFRTTRAVDLVPLSIRDVAYQAGSQGASRLVLDFAMDPGGAEYVFHPRGIGLFFHAPLATASLLFTWLREHCRGITVRSSSRLSGIRLPADAIRPTGFDGEGGLFPWPPAASPGLRAVLEYFTLPEKFLFVDVVGLDQAARAAAERFVLEFDLEHAPPPPTRLDRDMVRLGCAPAVNLFPSAAEPLRVDPLRTEQPLIVADLPPTHAEVHSVTSIIGMRPGHGSRRPIRPFFAHERERGAPSYVLRRRPAVVDHGIDTFLALSTPRDAAPLDGQEVLSIEVLASNRDLANDLGPGDLTQPTAGSPTGTRFTNITRVSKPVRPPIDGELHWRILAHLMVGKRVLGDAVGLRALLSLYNFHAAVDLQAARANELRIESVRSNEATTVTRAIGRAPVRGWQTTISLDEPRLAGPGEAYLFGCVLDELFAGQVGVGNFNELRVELHPSRASFRWRPRCGDRRIG